jgi:hypothetical protein
MNRNDLPALRGEEGEGMTAIETLAELKEFQKRIDVGKDNELTLYKSLYAALEEIAILDKELKERREDEKWLLDHPEVLAVHTYGDDGFALDYGHGTSAEIAHSTIHAAIAARGK